ncbi:DNA glycosylase AlkZ-like family protein [Actinoplanes sp. ATCC 53533]|uniref:DNA glycosylase AlkZ-like family protein n=1 Tax=Actinoplanes sp. ATCC 53533 TaxID=1288362 RepID=UPI001F3660FD|nr:crosslink repair DNA glycosylase YcaQ family protein [Actinoplanes sp. ATCC 53533]
MDVDRGKVMAYRLAALGLAERGDDRPGDLPVLDLGVQEYTPGSARVALAARTSAELADDRLLTVWAARGAPHLHRRRDLKALVKALWPVSDADAAVRIRSAQIPDAGKLGIRAFTLTARAFREVVHSSMPRGEVSTQVTRLVPAELVYDCRGCGARHIAGNIWQHAGLAGGVEVESRGRDATLGPIRDAPPQPTENDGIEALITTYLRLLGPATPAEVGKYLGSSTAEMKKVWPGDLAEVRIDGRRAWLPAGSLAALAAAEPTPGVRLVPAMDPLLQARDRDLLVPERARQKEIWKLLGNPGALLLEGEIAGVWRAKMAGKKRVDLTVTPFGTLTVKARKSVERESAVVARARGAAEATVTFD